MYKGTAYTQKDADLTSWFESLPPSQRTAHTSTHPFIRASIHSPSYVETGTYMYGLVTSTYTRVLAKMHTSLYQLYSIGQSRCPFAVHAAAGMLRAPYTQQGCLSCEQKQEPSDCSGSPPSSNDHNNDKGRLVGTQPGRVLIVGGLCGCGIILK